MQPFDALTIKAILQEAKPLLLNHRVDKIYQLSRDEVIIALRLKSGRGNFLLSAQPSFGRLCLTMAPIVYPNTNLPGFCLILRKYLAGAVLSEIEQLPGERIVDFSFSCMDELGVNSTKILTAEIMGRHSNLIFWDKQTKRILGVSHVVNNEMSRLRALAPGLLYVRPPHQDKPNILNVTEEIFLQHFASLVSFSEQNSPTFEQPATLEQWLIATFAGMGRHLAEEMVVASKLPNDIAQLLLVDEAQGVLWNLIDKLQTTKQFRASMRLDLTSYSVLSWWQDAAAAEASWKTFPSVNDMVEHYFRTLQEREQARQTKEKMRVELKAELEKLELRITAALRQLESKHALAEYKNFGDLILANLSDIKAGQSELVCEDLYVKNIENDTPIKVELKPDLTPVQNAQYYYRQYAKARIRQQAANIAQADASLRLGRVKQLLESLEQADSLDELNKLKEIVLGQSNRVHRPDLKTRGALAKQPRLLKAKSADGRIIYVGRNRQENDLLISKLAQPHDIWFHIVGQEGAHVLLKNPNRNNNLPVAALQEAAQLAARFSRISLGAKVKVAYTFCRYVHKIAKNKPGLVRYENEKILDVDTSTPLPESFKRLFSF